MEVHRCFERTYFLYLQGLSVSPSNDSRIAGGKVRKIPGVRILHNQLREKLKFNAKQSLFIVRIIRNTKIHCVGRMLSFSMLKTVVHIVTAVL
jgi:hypothetical protein